MKRHFFILNLLIILIFLCGCNQSSFVSQGTGYDNSKIGWGFRKIQGAQPEIPASWAEMLKKYDGYYIGNAQKKVMFLTFDEGYENGYTSQILDVLKKTNTKAAFFVTGPYIDKEQELIKRMVAKGI